MDKAKDHHGMVGSEFPKEKHSSRPSSVMSNNSSKTHDVSILVHNVIISTTYNASQKHESTLLHTYVPKDFLTVLVQQNVFEKTLVEVSSPHLYASFGTFCAQISQLFEAQ